MDRRNSVIFGIVILATAIACLLWFSVGKRRVTPTKDEAKTDLQRLEEGVTRTQGEGRSQSQGDGSLTNRTGKVQPAVELLYRFAQAAKLYNFDPQVTGYRETRSPHRSDYTNILV